MDSRCIPQIQAVFSQLQTRLMLLDTEGNTLIPADGARCQLPEHLEKGGMLSAGEHLFIKPVKDDDIVLMAPDDQRGASKDALLLACALIAALGATRSGESALTGAYRRILQNELSVAEMDAAISEYQIPAATPRCVLLFHMVQVRQSSACDILGEILPQAASDVLVPMDKHTAALIKDVVAVEDMDELKQYACAAQETLLGETGLPVTIGIGESAQGLDELHASYRQARRAIEIGRVYRADDTVHVYSTMLLERFLSDLPADTAAHYHDLLFNRHTARLFSEEMLFTIEMFFKKDLNLSDTARQLFIHRNTLVYRLDKVQRQVGLDLRKFEDAVTFKMLLEMKKCMSNRAKKTE